MIGQLGKTEENVMFTDDEAMKIHGASQLFINCGFAPLQPQGTHLYSHLNNSSDDIGKIRVEFKYARCGKASICGQQMVEPTQKVFTVRAWNPKKLDVPYGGDVSPDSSAGECFLPCCCCCGMVN